MSEHPRSGKLGATRALTEIKVTAMSESATVNLTDDAQATPNENRLAARILMVIAAILVLAIVIVAIFGLPALGLIGLAATAVIFVALISIMLGN